jgi:hypothetical protein
VFERYTEAARRTIFFARYEASQLGSQYIEPEHLLLALFREDKVLKTKIPLTAIEKIRREIEDKGRRPHSISTSVDIPLNNESKRVLSYGAEESERLRQSFIDSGHLLLGLLRESQEMAELLRPHGITLEAYRHIVSAVRPAGVASPEPEPVDVEAASTSLRETIRTYAALVETTLDHLNEYNGADWEHRLKRKPWTRKQAIGHLIDWATTHHQWFARALTAPTLVAAGYPEDEWVEAQHYGDWPVEELTVTWGYVASLVLRVMSQIPEEKIETPCKIGIQHPMPLRKLVTYYVFHCQDVVAQILTLGDHV